MATTKRVTGGPPRDIAVSAVALTPEELPEYNMIELNGTITATWVRQWVGCHCPCRGAWPSPWPPPPPRGPM
jgi:hypothetical protein